MEPLRQRELMMTRRQLFGKTATGIGVAALSSLLSREGMTAVGSHAGGALLAPHHTPKAKRVIYLFMSGAPSHIDLYDNKPKLKEMTGELSVSP